MIANRVFLPNEGLYPSDHVVQMRACLGRRGVPIFGVAGAALRPNN